MTMKYWNASDIMAPIIKYWSRRPGTALPLPPHPPVPVPMVRWFVAAQVEIVPGAPSHPSKSTSSLFPHVYELYCLFFCTLSHDQLVIFFNNSK